MYAIDELSENGTYNPKQFIKGIRTLFNFIARTTATLSDHLATFVHEGFQLGKHLSSTNLRYNKTHPKVVRMFMQTPHYSRYWRMA